VITDQPIEFVGVPTKWADDNPWYLHIVRPNAAEQIIDLGEYQWATTYAEWMRGRSRWYLVRKADNFPVLVIDVGDDDQPYYTARHIGKIGSGGTNQIIAYGIGAKRYDGVIDRLWILPGGMVCAGDDVDGLGIAIVEALGPQ
jgi:hypothetical protein